MREIHTCGAGTSHSAVEDGAEHASSPCVLMRSVVLIGMMGAGKSSVGQILAQNLGVAFADSDRLISKAAGCTIPQIFAEEGEAGFRVREYAVIKHVLCQMPSVIAAGGGAFTCDKTRDLIKTHADTVYLNLPETILVKRLTAGRRDGDTSVGTRPLLGGDDWQVQLHELIVARADSYAQCDIILNLEDHSVECVAALIEQKLIAYH